MPELLPSQGRTFESATGTGGWTARDSGAPIAPSQAAARSGLRSCEVACSSDRTRVGLHRELVGGTALAPGTPYSVSGWCAAATANGGPAQARLSVEFYTAQGVTLQVDRSPDVPLVQTWYDTVPAVGGFRYVAVAGLVPDGTASVLVRPEVVNVQNGSFFPLYSGSKFYWDDLSVDGWTAPPAVEEGSAFWVIQADGDATRPDYVCEWGVVDGVPVHVRHAQFPQGSYSDNDTPVDLFVHGDYVYAFGYSYSSPQGNRAWKFSRADLSLVEEWSPQWDPDFQLADVASNQYGPGNTNGFIDAGPEKAYYWGDDYLGLIEFDPRLLPEGHVARHDLQSRVPEPYDPQDLDLWAAFGSVLRDGDTVVAASMFESAVFKFKMSDPSFFELYLDFVGDWDYPGTPEWSQVTYASSDHLDGTPGVWNAVSNAVLSVADASDPDYDIGPKSLWVSSASPGQVVIETDPLPVDDWRALLRFRVTYRNDSSGTRRVAFDYRWLDAAGNTVKTGQYTQSQYPWTPYWDVPPSWGWRRHAGGNLDFPPPEATHVTFRLLLGEAGQSTTFQLQNTVLESQDPFLQTYQQSLTVSDERERIYCAFDNSWTGGLHAGWYPFVTETHSCGVAELTLDGELVAWHMIDPSSGTYPLLFEAGGSSVGTNFQTRGLALTPGGRYLVHGMEGNSSSPDNRSHVWVRDLDTGRNSWAPTPHHGYAAPAGYPRTGIQVLAAFPDRSKSVPPLGRMGVVRHRPRVR